MNAKIKTRRFASTAIATALAATALAAVPTGGRRRPSSAPSSTRRCSPRTRCPRHPCTHQDPGLSCTMVENSAYYRPDGGERAPKTGTIRRIRLVAGGPGSFRLQIAKVKRSTLFGTNEAKVLRNGPVIHYQGQSQQNWDSDHYNVESFKVNVPVKRGEYLAMRTKYTSMVRCSSGGDNTLIYQAPLLAGGGFTPAKSTDGCWTLMEAVIK